MRRFDALRPSPPPAPHLLRRALRLRLRPVRHRPPLRPTPQQHLLLSPHHRALNRLRPSRGRNRASRAPHLQIRATRTRSAPQRRTPQAPRRATCTPSGARPRRLPPRRLARRRAQRPRLPPLQSAPPPLIKSAKPRRFPKNRLIITAALITALLITAATGVRLGEGRVALPFQLLARCAYSARLRLTCAPRCLSRGWRRRQVHESPRCPASAPPRQVGRRSLGTYGRSAPRNIRRYAVGPRWVEPHRFQRRHGRRSNCAWCTREQRTREQRTHEHRGRSPRARRGDGPSLGHAYRCCACQHLDCHQHSKRPRRTGCSGARDRTNSGALHANRRRAPRGDRDARPVDDSPTTSARRQCNARQLARQRVRRRRADLTVDRERRSRRPQFGDTRSRVTSRQRRAGCTHSAVSPAPGVSCRLNPHSARRRRIIKLVQALELVRTFTCRCQRSRHCISRNARRTRHSGGRPHRDGRTTDLRPCCLRRSGGDRLRAAAQHDDGTAAGQRPPRRNNGRSSTRPSRCLNRQWAPQRALRFGRSPIPGFQTNQVLAGQCAEPGLSPSAGGEMDENRRFAARSIPEAAASVFPPERRSGAQRRMSRWQESSPQISESEELVAGMTHTQMDELAAARRRTDRAAGHR